MPQPVLGILTLYLNQKKHLEEKAIYQRMIAEGKRLGLDVFVFTPMDVYDNKQKIYALNYNPSTRKWSRKWRSFPHIIYDRCRIQHTYRFEQLRQFRIRYNHLTFLNRPLRDKWTIYQSLYKSPRFRPHLPETALIKTTQDVYQMLNKKNAMVYIKPINGTGGRGILRIERLEPKQYRVQGRNLNRGIIPSQVMHTSRLGVYMFNWRNGKSYIVQEGIHTKLPSGQVHDYRMLVQKSGTGQWELTGCAGRVGALRSVTSNLHGGGRAIAMNTLLKQWIPEEDKRVMTMQTAERLGIDIASYLEETYGPLCELALDLAIKKNGDIYVLEINPKPAREVFAQTGEHDVYLKAITRPLEYAMWIYKRGKSIKG